MAVAQAIIGGGCFWCLEAVLEQLNGVVKIQSGYAGGELESPSYRQVCSGTSGHAEVVLVEFDQTVIAYRELLEIFFAFHDPTTENRQGPDVGSQYRSIIIVDSDHQRAEAEATISRLNDEGVFDAPIVTEVVGPVRFWPAESGHNGYYRRNPDQAYCQAVISPKIAKLRSQHVHRLKP